MVTRSEGGTDAYRGAEGKKMEKERERGRQIQRELERREVEREEWTEGVSEYAGGGKMEGMRVEGKKWKTGRSDEVEEAGREEDRRERRGKWE